MGEAAGSLPVLAESGFRARHLLAPVQGWEAQALMFLEGDSDAAWTLTSSPAAHAANLSISHRSCSLLASLSQAASWSHVVLSVSAWPQSPDRWG